MDDATAATWLENKVIPGLDHVLTPTRDNPWADSVVPTVVRAKLTARLLRGDASNDDILRLFATKQINGKKLRKMKFNAKRGIITRSKPGARKIPAGGTTNTGGNRIAVGDDDFMCIRSDDKEKASVVPVVAVAVPAVAAAVPKEDTTVADLRKHQLLCQKERREQGVHFDPGFIVILPGDYIRYPHNVSLPVARPC